MIEDTYDRVDFTITVDAGINVSYQKEPQDYTLTFTMLGDESEARKVLRALKYGKFKVEAHVRESRKLL